MSKHTLGPWRRKKEQNGMFMDGIREMPMVIADHRWICALPKSSAIAPECLEECEANARLIAAAPELLEAAGFAIWSIVGVLSEKNLPQEMRDTLEDAQTQLETAIAKAEGNSDEPDGPPGPGL